MAHAEQSRPSGQWRDDDYDVLENGVVVGRIFKVPIGRKRPRADQRCGAAGARCRRKEH
jgi:hypothetical protein